MTAGNILETTARASSPGSRLNGESGSRVAAVRLAVSFESKASQVLLTLRCSAVQMSSMSGAGGTVRRPVSRGAAAESALMRSLND